MKKTKICPFCNESILAEAVKCKYCGEWLQPAVYSGPLWPKKGTSGARAVTKGLKEKELDDSFINIGLVAIFIIAYFLGTRLHYVVGIVFFIIALAKIITYYFKE